MKEKNMHQKKDGRKCIFESEHSKRKKRPQKKCFFLFLSSYYFCFFFKKNWLGKRKEIKKNNKHHLLQTKPLIVAPVVAVFLLSFLFSQKHPPFFTIYLFCSQIVQKHLFLLEKNFLDSSLFEIYIT